MKWWKILDRRKALKKVRPFKISFVGSHAINSMLKDAESRSKEEVLEIGDINLDDRLTVDFVEGADYVGDIRAFFSSDYEFTDSIRALQARQGSFAVVRMQHVLEHIQWIHQAACLQWVNSLLDDGGMVYIETPNIEFVAKMYLKNLENLENGKPVRFPANEYPGMLGDVDNSEKNEMNFWKWINFKIYSGCSLGDYHHCAYDPYWLSRMMKAAGFGQISMCARDTVRAIGFKLNVPDTESLDKVLDAMFAS